MDLTFRDIIILIGGVILYLWQIKVHLHKLNLSWQMVFLPDVTEVGRAEGKREGHSLYCQDFFFYSPWFKLITRPDVVTSKASLT